VKFPKKILREELNATVKEWRLGGMVVGERADYTIVLGLKKYHPVAVYNNLTGELLTAKHGLPTARQKDVCAACSLTTAELGNIAFGPCLGCDWS
jgi:hypothetical protein